MAFRHGKDSKIYGNGYDLTSYFSSLNTPFTQETVETTTFSKSNKTKLAGVGDGSMSGEGYYDPSANAADEVLRAAMGTAAGIWAHLPAGDTAGYPAIMISSIGTSYEVVASTDAAVSFSMEGECDQDGVVGGLIVTPYGAVVATGNGATLDNAASSANGAIIDLQVFAIAGAAPSVTLEVRHSTDNFGASNDLLGTFTVVTAAPTKQRLLIAAATTVNRYVRVRHVFGGTTTSITYFAAMRRN